MKEFNYGDFLHYQKLKRKEFNTYQLQDCGEEYRIHQPHDKIFKMVLSEKRQMAVLLNRVLNLEKTLDENDIEKYCSEHIDYMFQKSESDIVYKMKNKEIFFLIEHQRKIDYDMPKRILEYEVEIIKEAVRGKTMTKKDHRLPRVIPIVIYTGSRKWNVEKYIEECQEVLSEAERVKLGEYYVLDANDYTNQELENDKLFLSKMMLLEKLTTEKEIFEMLNKTIQEEKEEGNREILKRIITYILTEKLKSEDREKLLKKLEKEEESNMVIEVIRKENQRLRSEGIREGIKKGKEAIIVKMIKNKMDENTIKLMAEITQEELNKIKRAINE